MASCLDIDDYSDPPIAPDPSWYEWIIVAVIAAVIVASVIAVHAGEAEKPEIWAYVSKGCAPCRRFKQDNKDGKLSDFTIYVIEVNSGTVPRFVFWNKSHTRAAPTLNGYGDPQDFRMRYREAMK